MIINEQKAKEKIKKHNLFIACDECAAGNLGGDLFVCGIIMKNEDLSILFNKVNDSKKLLKDTRSTLFDDIIKNAIDYEIVRITPNEIDEINILNARMKGFQKAIEILSSRNDVNYAIIDGNKQPNITKVETDCIIKGDLFVKEISCASIIAKVSHTNYINELCNSNEKYKLYSLESNQGYGTKKHLEALEQHGYIEGFHRKSYKPVKNTFENKN